jgi:hypothetical protein
MKKQRFANVVNFHAYMDEAAATGAGYSLLFFGGIISPGLQVVAGVCGYCNVQPFRAVI